MPTSIVEYLSKQQRPLTDTLKGSVAIAVSPSTAVYESVNKTTGADSGKVLVTYPAGAKIGVIQQVGYIGQKLFAQVTLLTYFTHPSKPGYVIKQVLIPIERLLFDPKPVAANQVELYSLGNNVNVRASASVYAKSVALYNKGQLVGSGDGKLLTSTDTVSNKKWYKITTTTGKAGYIREDVVSSSKPAGSPIPVPSGTNQVTPSPEQKGAELDGAVVDGSNTPLRNVLYYGGITLLAGIGLWVLNHLIKRNGSKK